MRKHIIFKLNSITKSIVRSKNKMKNLCWIIHHSALKCGELAAAAAEAWRRSLSERRRLNCWKRRFNWSRSWSTWCADARACNCASVRRRSRSPNSFRSVSTSASNRWHRECASQHADLGFAVGDVGPTLEPSTVTQLLKEMHNRSNGCSYGSHVIDWVLFCWMKLPTSAKPLWQWLELKPNGDCLIYSWNAQTMSTSWVEGLCCAAITLRQGHRSHIERQFMTGG